MIPIDERFDVASPPEVVWRILADPHAVVGCVAGASLGDRSSSGEYDASLEVRFGPTRVTFRAKVALEIDDAARTGRLAARGKDGKGGTRITSTVGFRVVPSPAGGSTVIVRGEAELSGPLAGLIERGAEVVVRRMAGDFAAALAARCRSAQPA